MHIHSGNSVTFWASFGGKLNIDCPLCSLDLFSYCDFNPDLCMYEQFSEF